MATTTIQENIMADVYAVFGTLLALGIAFPGMLVAYWLLFPHQVEKASHQLTEKPGRTFVLGLGSALVLSVPITIFFVAGLPFTSFLGALSIVTVLAIATIGAAGMALKMGRRLAEKTNPDKPIRSFLGGAVALELAAAFPFVGWLLVIPVVLILSLGASLTGIWGKKPTPTIPVPASAEA
jgi:hypothetical protein